MLRNFFSRLSPRISQYKNVKAFCLVCGNRVRAKRYATYAPPLCIPVLILTILIMVEERFPLAVLSKGKVEVYNCFEAKSANRERSPCLSVT